MPKINHSKLYVAGDIPAAHRVAVFRALLSVLDDVRIATIDAYPDPRWSKFSALPPYVRAAQELIADLGREQGGRRDLLMAVVVDMSVAAYREAVVAFAPYSIQVELSTGVDDLAVAGMSDEGSEAFIRLCVDAAETFFDLLSGIPVTFTDMSAQRRTSRLRRWGIWKR